MTDKPHGLTGQKNAQKKEEAAEAHLHMRCLPSEKNLWVKAAQGNGGLSAWVSKTLNDAAKKQLKIE